MKKVYPEMINVRLTERQMQGLRRVADDNEISMSDVVRDLIKSRLEESK